MSNYHDHRDHRFIEESITLHAISARAAREKSIHHGHISHRVFGGTAGSSPSVVPPFLML